MPRPDWNERYAADDLPWDTREPDPHLVELVESGRVVPGRAFEVGCGTGTNAWWLAGRGFAVRAIDLSPLAIERARGSGPAGVACRFEVRDFLAGDPPTGPFELVFDRGVFHVFDEPAVRSEFAARVARLLAPAGQWVSVIGSTEGPPRDHGPPRRSARDIVDAVEPVLSVSLLRASEFHGDLPSPAAAWLLIARPRSIPAQPSTRRDP